MRWFFELNYDFMKNFYKRPDGSVYLYSQKDEENWQDWDFEDREDFENIEDFLRIMPPFKLVSFDFGNYMDYHDYSFWYLDLQSLYYLGGRKMDTKVIPHYYHPEKDKIAHITGTNYRTSVSYYVYDRDPFNKRQLCHKECKLDSLSNEITSVISDTFFESSFYLSVKLPYDSDRCLEFIEMDTNGNFETGIEGLLSTTVELDAHGLLELHECAMYELDILLHSLDEYKAMILKNAKSR